MPDDIPEICSCGNSPVTLPHNCRSNTPGVPFLTIPKDQICQLLLGAPHYKVPGIFPATGGINAHIQGPVILQGKSPLSVPKVEHGNSQINEYPVVTVLTGQYLVKPAMDIPYPCLVAKALPRSLEHQAVRINTRYGAGIAQFQKTGSMPASAKGGITDGCVAGKWLKRLHHRFMQHRIVNDTHGQKKETEPPSSSAASWNSSS